MKTIQVLTWGEFAGKYCERQEQTLAGLAKVLNLQVLRFDPDGFMLLECQMLDSSRLGEYTILPYGPRNTFQTIPDHPISPRGLASDMSVVVGVLKAGDVPIYLH